MWLDLNTGRELAQSQVDGVEREENQLGPLVFAAGKWWTFAGQVLGELDLLMKIYLVGSAGTCLPPSNKEHDALSIAMHKVTLNVVRAMIRADKNSAEKLQQVVNAKRQGVTNIYVQLKKFRLDMTHEPPNIFADLMPNRDHPEISRAVTLYRNGKFKELEKLMKFWDHCPKDVEV